MHPRSPTPVSPRRDPLHATEVALRAARHAPLSAALRAHVGRGLAEGVWRRRASRRRVARVGRVALVAGFIGGIVWWGHPPEWTRPASPTGQAAALAHVSTAPRSGGAEADVLDLDDYSLSDAPE